MTCTSLILLQIFIILAEICSAGRQMKISMKSVKCESPVNIYNGSFTECTLKPTRDRLGLLTMVYNFRKPARDIHLQIKPFYKYGTVFRPWLFEFTHEVCLAIENIETVPLFGKLIYKGMNEQVPGFIHHCPYVGIEGFRNVTVDKVVNAIFPQVIPKGEYKVYFRGFTKNNETIGWFFLNFLLDSTDPMKSMQMGKK